MRAFSLVLVATSASTASAFALGAPVTWKPIAAATPTMGLFDGLAKAFENDSTLGERENAGLSKEKQKRTVTWVGPKGQQKKATVVPGQKLKDIARSCGIPIRYDCQEGTCKTW